MFGEVVVYDEGVATGVADVFAYGYTCKWRVVAHGCRVAGGSGYNDGIVQSSVAAECVHCGRYGGCFLADGYVYAVYGFAGFEVFALVDDGVNCDGCFAYLTVADYELALASAYGDHCIDCFYAGLQGLVYGLAVNYARRFAFQGHFDELAGYGAAAVYGFAQDVDDASEESFADGDGGDVSGTADVHAFGNGVDVVHQDDADVGFFEVEGDAFDAVFKFDEFVGTDVVQSVDVCHAVAYVEHFADFFEGDVRIDVFKLLLEYFGYFAGVYHCRGWMCLVRVLLLVLCRAVIVSGVGAVVEVRCAPMHQGVATPG